MTTARWQILGRVLFVVAFLALAFAQRSTIEDATSVLGDIGWGRAALGLGLFGLGRGVLPAVAFAQAASEVSGVPARPAIVVVLRTALAKYLPGAIWQPLGVVEGLRRAGAPADRSALVMVVSTATTALAALLVGLAVLPDLTSGAPSTAIWLLLLVPFGVVLTSPARRILASLATRATGRAIDLDDLPSRVVAFQVGVQAVAWVVAGMSLAVVLDGLGADLPLGRVVAASSIAWLAGLVVIPAPAGLGVREVALVATLAPLSVEVALAAALVTRAYSIVVDFGGAALANLIRQPGDAVRSP